MAPSLTPRAVRQLVRAGRAVKAHNYHAGKRGIPWAAILAALERCYFVAQDNRGDPQGAPAHPDGWYALFNLPHKRRLRVDFDLHQDGDALLLVVTAYDV